jgi:hypothetical protein
LEIFKIRCRSCRFSKSGVPKNNHGPPPQACSAGLDMPHVTLHPSPIHPSTHPPIHHPPSTITRPPSTITHYRSPVTPQTSRFASCATRPTLSFGTRRCRPLPIPDIPSHSMSFHAIPRHSNTPRLTHAARGRGRGGVRARSGSGSGSEDGPGWPRMAEVGRGHAIRGHGPRRPVPPNAAMQRIGIGPRSPATLEPGKGSVPGARRGIRKAIER